MTVGLDEPHPLTFLAHASGLWETLTRHAGDAAPAVNEFVFSLLETDARRSTALLTALAPLVDDPLLARRIGRELAGRTHSLPTWLTTLGQVRPTLVRRQTEPLQDADQYWIELQWPQGDVLSLGVLVDFNWGRALKDLLALPVPVSAVERVVASEDDGFDIVFLPIEPADLRAQVEQAMGLTDQFYPPVATETWPMGRPLLRWALGMLDQGGRGFEEHDLEEPARDRVVALFRESPEALGLADLKAEFVASTVDSLVWFAGFCDGDPLRWSPLKVEFLLTDWWHRKIVQPAADDRRLPRILRAFVRWCGAQRHIPESLVAHTLGAIDDLEPAFSADIGTPRRNTALDLARLVGGFDPDVADEDDSSAGDLLDLLAAQVGGRDALETLDEVPLPEEDFDAAGIAPDLLAVVEAALAAFESELRGHGWPEETELRTAGRRLMRRLALARPELLRRRVSEGSTACTLTHLVYAMNDRLGREGVRADEINRAFGMKSTPTSRVSQFRSAVVPPVSSGDAWLLTGRARARILRLSELWREL